LTKLFINISSENLRVTAVKILVAGFAIAFTQVRSVLATTAAPASYAEGEPCAAFTDDAVYVDFSLLMGLEQREVEMRIPKSFFEDRWKQQNGGQHTALLFRVMIDSFRPVARRETPSLNFEYMGFLIHDLVELPKIAEVKYQGAHPGSGRQSVNSMPFAEDITPFDYDLAPFNYGLDRIVPLAGDVQDDVYLALSDGNLLAAVVSCDTPEWVQYPGCEQYFVSQSGVDVQISYRLKYLPLWAELQNNVEAFLQCATKSNSE